MFYAAILRMTSISWMKVSFVYLNTVVFKVYEVFEWCCLSAKLQ